MKKSAKSHAPFSGNPKTEAYTLQEAALLLNTSKSKMAAMLRDGDVPVVRLRGGVLRIPIDSFRRWAKLPPLRA